MNETWHGVPQYGFGSPGCTSWGVLTTILLSTIACSVGPKYVRPSVQSPAAYKELHATSSNDSGSVAHGQAQTMPRTAANGGRHSTIPQLNELEEAKASSSNQESPRRLLTFSLRGLLSVKLVRNISRRSAPIRASSIRGRRPDNLVACKREAPRSGLSVSRTPTIRCPSMLPGSRISGARFATR